MPFKPGQSGNPGGRPKGYAEFQAECREHSPKALAVMLANLKHKDPRIRHMAAESLWDRGWGKAAQAVTGPGGEGNGVIIVRSRIERGPAT